MLPRLPVQSTKQTPENGASSSPSFSERQRIWKEEPDKELEIERETAASRRENLIPKQAVFLSSEGPIAFCIPPK